jgi:lysozyme family protein
LVDPHDVAGLAAAIAELLDAGRPPQSGPARTWNDTANDYLALFDSLERRQVAT